MGYYFDWFDWKGFRTSYLNGSTYKDKESLIDDFHRVFYNVTDYSLSQGRVYDVIKKYWDDPKIKSQVKAQLLGKGHTRGAINGICKYFETALSYKL